MDAVLLSQFYSYPNSSHTGGQLCRDKECPFSGLPVLAEFGGRCQKARLGVGVWWYCYVCSHQECLQEAASNHHSVCLQKWDQGHIYPCLCTNLENSQCFQISYFYLYVCTVATDSYYQSKINVWRSFKLDQVCFGMRLFRTCLSNMWKRSKKKNLKISCLFGETCFVEKSSSLMVASGVCVCACVRACGE